MLSRLHAHPLDSRITFYVPTHTYTIKYADGNVLPRKPKSVTTVIHQYFSPFQPDVVIDRMMASSKWSQSMYYGLSRQEIKDKWQEGNKLGTLLHDTIEKYYNEELKHSGMVDPRIATEFVYFLQFVIDFQLKNPGWRPYRTEWFVYDLDYEIAGAIDFTFTNDAGEIWIVDWKRSREIRMSNDFQSGDGCLSHLDDCNYIHYCLQLNLYRRLLERNYGKRVVKLDLLILHPNNSNYVPVSIPFMDKEIDDILAMRWQELHN
jgi:ATP-dependent exoDNAse (exonuclease V) beta subunit